jgi:hypothetical protein
LHFLLFALPDLSYAGWCLRLFQDIAMTPIQQASLPVPGSVPPAGHPPLPVLLRDLKLPDEVQHYVDEHWQTMRWHKFWEKGEVERLVKVAYFFQGKQVVCEHAREGDRILAAGEHATGEMIDFTNRLSRRRQRQIDLYGPFRWDEERARWAEAEAKALARKNGPPPGLPAFVPPLPVPFLLRDLKLPEDWQKDVEEDCRGLWWKRDKLRVEEDAKLQYFFGGWTVAYQRTPQGILILAAGDRHSFEFEEVIDNLSREEYEKTIVRWQFPWDVEVILPR